MTTEFDKAALERALEGVELEAESREAIERLDADDVARIDRAILKALDGSWKKAGFIVAGVMIAAPDAHEDIPEVVYTFRIRSLVQAGRIEAQGDPLDLKTYEIRVPADATRH